MRARLLILFILTSAAHGETTRYLTTVSPLPSENIAQPCRYELVISDSSKPVRAVWVIFDRGRDLLRIYNHLEVTPFLRKNRLALMMPFHCREKRGTPNDEPGNDMDMEPKDGLGRALFAALTQFADSSRHPEIATSKLILLGFSGTGSLVARLVAFAPERIVASISSAPGHWKPLGIESVILSPDALVVPQLIIANSEDKPSGTNRPYQYFLKYSRLGAPMAFILQNGVPHCCIVNAEDLIVSWVGDIIRERKPDAKGDLRKVRESRGLYLFLKVQDGSTKDENGNKDWIATDGIVQRKSQPIPSNYIAAGWMPTKRLASAWLHFVKEPHHPDTSVP